MRNRIKALKAMQARKAWAEKEQQPAPSAEQPLPTEPDVPHYTPAASSGESTNYALLVVRTGLALLLILALVFAANEAMVFLLK